MRARSALQIATRATPTSAKTAPQIPTIPQPQHNSNRFAKILKRESAYEIKKRCFCKHLKSFESYSPNFRQFFQTSQC